MLYNPTWDAKPFTMEHFIGWLGKQPADKRYEYIDCQNCLMAQYFRAHSDDHYTPAPVVGYGDVFPKDQPFATQAEWIAWQGYPHPQGYTFGKALERALEHTSVMAVA